MKTFSAKDIKRKAKYFEMMADSSVTLGWIKNRIDEHFDDWLIESAYAFTALMVKFQYPFNTHDAGGNFDEKIGEEFDLSPIDFGFIDEICAMAEKRFPDDNTDGEETIRENRLKAVENISNKLSEKN